MTIQVSARIRAGVSAFHQEQASAFVAYFSRLRGADLEDTFLRWAASKDFHPKDRRDIRCEVARLLAEGDRRGGRW